MHLDEEQVQRLLHGQLSQPVETSAREHLAGCSDCRGRVAEAQREEEEVHALLSHVDHPGPRIDAGAVAARGRAHDAGWVRWAAGILLALGVAGTAYGVPGSPVPAWVKAVVNRIAPARPLTPEPEGGAGIAVAPGGTPVVLFTSRQAEGQAEVSLTDAPRWWCAR